MKTVMPVLVKDHTVTTSYPNVPLTEPFTLDGEDVVLDGPVSRRVAVVDFDASGRLTPGVPLKRSSKGLAYAVPTPGKPADLYDVSSLRVTTFAGIHKTLAMFEEPDCLGRKIQWAFNGPQLLVVPRAGEWANAFYERDSRSLQFFSVTTPTEVIHTALSQDIIAHETAHAIIDGVAPDLYHAQTPQGLALHEAVADIATVLMAFRSTTLTRAILAARPDAIKSSSHFTKVADQLGSHLKQAGRPLRELFNNHALADVDQRDPHALSTVLSGALYKLMVSIYPDVLERRRREHPKDGPEVALFIASRRFQRTILRALDYLPPGEISFKDFGRAMWASDEASYPDGHQQRHAIAEEFRRRGIIKARKELDPETNFASPALDGVDLEELRSSDWLAYEFADSNRRLLGIPRTIPFEVRPRLDVTKKYYHRDEQNRRVEEFIRELLFKVTWFKTEACRVPGVPRKREIRMGTTLAIEWARHEYLSKPGREVTSHEWPRSTTQTRRIRAILTNDGGAHDAKGRDGFLLRLLEREELGLDEAAYGPDGRRLRGVVRGDTRGGTLRLGATARALHMAPGGA